MSGTEATVPGDSGAALEDKGKGKAPAEEVPQDTSMEQDEEEDDSSSDEEEEVCIPLHARPSSLPSQAQLS